MNPPLYDRVLDLSFAITNASSEEDAKAVWGHYASLETLCHNSQSTELDHPLQWEALADFTSDDGQSISIYETALQLADQLDLPEYVASIHLALAERYQSLAQLDLASTHAHCASSAATELSDFELRRSIGQFLLNLSAPNE